LMIRVRQSFLGCWLWREIQGSISKNFATRQPKAVPNYFSLASPFYMLLQNITACSNEDINFKRELKWIIVSIHVYQDILIFIYG